MKFHFKTTLMMTMVTSLSFASTNKVGNGGDVVSCKSSTQLLDFYEDERSDYVAGQKDHMKIVKMAYARFEKVAPNIFGPYQSRLDRISKEIEFKKNVRLTDIKDSNELYLPKGCQLIQIAIRKNRAQDSEPRFLIDSHLWKKLDSTHKAGLISHEIIYEHLSKIGEMDSVNVRKLNRFVMAKNSTPQDFWKVVQELKLPLYP